MKVITLLSLVFVLSLGVHPQAFGQDTTLGLNSLPIGLPKVLALPDGTGITSQAQWGARRAELQNFFTQHVYGRMPPRPPDMRFVVVEQTPDALNGEATRKQITILLDGNANGPQLHVLLYIPNHVHRPPVFLGLNFWGNQAINADPGILLSQRWVVSGENPHVDLSCVKDHLATSACRGISASRWPLATILKRGYALAIAYRGDIDPDRIGGFSESIRAAYPELQRGRDNFSTIGAWSWALSRILDYLETDSDVNAKETAVFGWSRLGKSALWAAATDQRFALAVSDDSGAAGAKLFRRDKGETIRDLNTNFPYWFCRNFKEYNGQDATLGFDQHLMLALIAPRPLYIASAVDDHWADPEGEFLGALAVSPVYKLLGTSGLPTDHWPALNHPVMGQIGYHVRSGGHDLTAYDWAQFLKFADVHFKK